MKNILLLLLAWPISCFAQQPRDLHTEMLSIADIEKKGAESFFQNKMGSLASGNFDIHHYRCEWQVDPAVRYISGSITSSFTIMSPTNNITFDCSSQLNIDSVRYHGANINFQRDILDALTIQFPSALSVNTKDSVTVFYQGVPPAAGFGSFYQGLHASTPVIWTLSEPYGSRDWWPCKSGLDDKADSIDVYLTYPYNYVGSTNGMMIDQQSSGGYITSHFTHHHPIASYLVGIAVTNYVVNYDTVQANGKVYPYISYAYPERNDLFPGEVWTKECIRMYSELIGDFPFEKYGQTQWGWNGGMEHQTNSFVLYTSRFLTTHELAHQWFGDKVTCGSWSDIWLNEGFANYLTCLYYERLFPPVSVGLLNQAINVVTAVPNGSVYVRDTTDVNKIFSSRLTYQKGMFVVHMLRWVLGDSVFFKGLRQYLNDPKLKYGFAKTADLQRNLEEVSGKNLSTFFQQWIYGEGWPSYSAVYTQNNNLWVKVKLDQTTSDPSVAFYQMPVQLVFKNAIQTKKFVVNHKYKKEEFWLNVGFVPDTLMIDPDSWILAKTKTTAKESKTSANADELLIYPNPSPQDGNVILRNPTGAMLSIQLFNALGQLVFDKSISTPGRDEFIQLPFNRMSRGTYWIRVRNDKNLRVIKKIVH
jgi:aminopeptidase N